MIRVEYENGNERPIDRSSGRRNGQNRPPSSQTHKPDIIRLSPFLRFESREKEKTKKIARERERERERAIGCVESSGRR
jgi:hypothetical protein